MRKSGAKTCLPRKLLPILQSETYGPQVRCKQSLPLGEGKRAAFRPKPMMNHDKDSWRRSSDRDPLFSRTVKAGKRVYYIDVKCDRRDEYYISMTESKRVQDGTETERPVFEKHKIFLYREDIINFLSALTDAAQFVGDHRSLDPHEYRSYDAPDAAAPAAPHTPAAEPDVTDPIDKIDLGSDFDIEF